MRIRTTATERKTMQMLMNGVGIAFLLFLLAVACVGLNWLVSNGYTWVIVAVGFLSLGAGGEPQDAAP